MPLRDVPGDGEAQPGAPGARGAGVVEPGEALEDPLPRRPRDARGRRRRRRAPRRPPSPRGSTTTRSPGMPDGVVEQVAARRARAARGRPAPGPAARRPVSTPRVAGSPDTTSGPHVVEVHRHRAAHRVPRRRRGPAGAGRRPAAAGATVSARTLAAVRRRVGGAPDGPASTSSSVAHPGQRAAQLVRGVGDEPALLLGRPVQPGEHGVHRARQAGDLLGGRPARAPLGRAGSR